MNLLIIIILAVIALILAYLLYKERIRSQKIIEFYSDNVFDKQAIEKQIAEIKKQQEKSITL